AFSSPQGRLNSPLLNSKREALALLRVRVAALRRADQMRADESGHWQGVGPALVWSQPACDKSPQFNVAQSDAERNAGGLWTLRTAMGAQASHYEIFIPCLCLPDGQT